MIHKLMKKNPHPFTPPRSHTSGFTLVELLVVITIIIVLAALTFSVTSKIRVAAAKTKSINQMRNIHVAVASYTADNSMIDAFYVSSPLADFWSESGNGSKYAPGNPAIALYNAEAPESGYIQDHTIFFSPLVDYPVPDKKIYNPANASSSMAWGTYAWYYPFASQAKLVGPQVGNAKAVDPGLINKAIEGRYMMSESYPSVAGSSPKFGKKIYHALMNDGSIQYVADNIVAYEKWRQGK